MKRHEKKTALLNKRNPIHANAQKLKKSQRELTHTERNNNNTFNAKLIKSETRLKIDIKN